VSSANAERRFGHAGFELIQLHDAARLGAPSRVARRLAEIAPDVEGPLAPLYAAHADALVTADGRKLDIIAASFADLGYILLAAETTIQAAAAHRGSGQRHRANTSIATARALAARCPGAATPALTILDPAAALTLRETEIAQLAAKGLSSRTIASHLVIAIRTVDNTLAAVYSKLGIRGRTQLPDALNERSMRMQGLETRPRPQLEPGGTRRNLESGKS
jgi:DNA-binding NarL/FixJ family response regulator